MNNKGEYISINNKNIRKQFYTRKISLKSPNQQPECKICQNLGEVGI
jgi:hypothetical protein